MQANGKIQQVSAVPSRERPAESSTSLESSRPSIYDRAILGQAARKFVKHLSGEFAIGDQMTDTPELEFVMQTEAKARLQSKYSNMMQPAIDRNRDVSAKIRAPQAQSPVRRISLSAMRSTESAPVH